jgi:hypothetical protein
MSPLTQVRREKPLEEKSLDVSREIQIERRSNMKRQGGHLCPTRLAVSLRGNVMN